MKTVNIRELLSCCGFTLVKTTVPTHDDLRKRNVVLNDNYLTVEDIEEHMGEPCYLLTDKVTGYTRACYLGETLAPKTYFDIIEATSAFMDDLLITDTLNYVFGTDFDAGVVYDDYMQRKLRNSGSVEDIYNYLKDNNIDIGSNMTYLYALVTDDTKYFEELKD